MELTSMVQSNAPANPPPAAPDDSGGGLSCLVISRTPALLNRMLASLLEARAFWHPGDEVLCSSPHPHPSVGS